MVTDFVHQDVGDDLAQGIFMFGINSGIVSDWNGKPTP